VLCVRGNRDRYISIPLSIMLIPKKNRLAVYSYLFKEGVITARKELVLTKHAHLEVPNLHVLKLLQSLKSRNLVKENFSWQWYYFTLTDQGIEYLREYLHVSADTVPATLKKASKPQPPPSFGRRDDDGGAGRGGRGRGRGGSRGRGGDREGYRGPKKFDGAPREFSPEFEGGRGGRGGGRGRGGFRGGRGGHGDAE